MLTGLCTALPARLGLMVIAPSYLTSMAEDPDGRKMIAAVICMVIVGHFVIRKIVRIKV